MKPIASFTVDHTTLMPGVYVSRQDRDEKTGAVITTFDMRITRPNLEPVMDTAAVHALEHLLATFLRNDSEWSERCVYVGPMGCRTGFYLLVFGEITPLEIAPALIRAFEQIVDFEGEIPGARPEACGNWHDADLNMAKWWASRYLKTLHTLDEKTTVYQDLLSDEGV